MLNEADRTALDRDPEILAAERDGVVVDANDRAGQLDFLAAADVGRGVRDRVRLRIGWVQYADLVVGHPLAHGCRDCDGVAYLDVALCRAVTLAWLATRFKRLLMFADNPPLVCPHMATGYSGRRLPSIGVELPERHRPGGPGRSAAYSS